MHTIFKKAPAVLVILLNSWFILSFFEIICKNTSSNALYSNYNLWILMTQLFEGGF